MEHTLEMEALSAHWSELPTGLEARGDQGAVTYVTSRTGHLLFGRHVHR